MAARDDTSSSREIAELTRRLRALTTAGRDADPTERSAFLADKAALLGRIETANRAGSDDARAEELDRQAPQRQTDGDDESRGW